MTIKTWQERRRSPGAMDMVPEMQAEIDDLRAENKRLASIVSGPSGIDPTSLWILLSQGDKRFYRVISSSELRQFKKPRRYVVDVATDLVNVFFAGDETMTEITP